MGPTWQPLNVKASYFPDLVGLVQKRHIPLLVTLSQSWPDLTLLSVFTPTCDANSEIGFVKEFY